ncbi:MAG: putative baseplate assembly protein [Gammaproteobacteria bacterium]|nr:putative baseplate assembly protein [Gammaproteobacteria bacterium]
MSDTNYAPQSACGCCAGINSQSPAIIHNRPGLSAIAYRIGDHADVLASLLARLSSKHYPTLSRLRTRDSDDFSIALLDAYAGIADVLSFYQERIANESYLRTAGERFSLQEMARLIGYRLNPGVAAKTYLAFTVDDAEGAPQQVKLEAGIKVQSVPGQDEKPQTFETVEAIKAQSSWNAIGVQTHIPWQPTFGDTDLYLAGTDHQLKPGDVILVVGEHRRKNSGSERWDARMVEKVEIENAFNRTRICWKQGLGHTLPNIEPAETDVGVYVFRQQAALFGHNAPDPHMLHTAGTQIATLIDTSDYSWLNFSIQSNLIDLDTTYNKIVPDSWILLVSNEVFTNGGALPGYLELYRATSVSIMSRSDYGLSSKITRIDPDTTENLWRYDLRNTLIYAQSEQLPTLNRPLLYPVFGNSLTLAKVVTGLVPNQVIGVSGKLARISIHADDLVLQLENEDTTRILSRGDSLQLAAAPHKLTGGAVVPLNPIEFQNAFLENPAPNLRLSLFDRNGSRGILDVSGDKIVLLSAENKDITMKEILHIADTPVAVSSDGDHTTLALANELSHVFDRSTVRINANVVRATHGETMHQILGSGKAHKAHQNFILKHAPLTFVSAKNESGTEAALEVRVNDIAWHETSSLFGAKANTRNYEVRVDEKGIGKIQFGDGRRGARLPTGQENIHAVYRKGLGSVGNLKAGQLSQLLTRPLGLKEVTNPQPSSGGVDKELVQDIRRNMPIGVRTLGRAVSLQDYEDFARAYTGIAKARADVLDIHGLRTIFITVAGTKGVRPETDGLLGSLKNNSDPFATCDAEAFREAYFKLDLRIKRHPDHDIDTVLTNVEAALRQAFSFNACEFGQIVARSEVINIAQQVTGVLGVDIDHFYRGSTAKLEDRLTAAPASLDSNGNGVAAELLLLAPGPFDKLEEMV